MMLSLILGCTLSGEAPSPALEPPAEVAVIEETERQLALVYTNNLDGEIEPCG